MGFGTYSIIATAYGNYQDNIGDGAEFVNENIFTGRPITDSLFVAVGTAASMNVENVHGMTGPPLSLLRIEEWK